MEEEGAGLREEDEDTQFHVEIEERGAECAPPLDGKGFFPLGLHYSRKQVMSNEQAEKLDVMMTICFQHFHNLCHHKGSILLLGSPVLPVITRSLTYAISSLRYILIMCVLTLEFVFPRIAL